MFCVFKCWQVEGHCLLTEVCSTKGGHGKGCSSKNELSLSSIPMPISYIQTSISTSDDNAEFQWCGQGGDQELWFKKRKKYIYEKIKRIREKGGGLSGLKRQNKILQFTFTRKHKEVIRI